MKVLFFSIALAVSANGATTALWKEILGPPQGKVPVAAGFTPRWRTNLAEAMAEARQENRPLFVTFRCLPCKQCADFDKEVLEGGPDLNPLLTQFITVRLTDAAAIDLRIFPVEGFADLDLSWWGWFLSPEGRIYGVFGGRDHVSDTTYMGSNTKSPAYKAGLRGGHVVTAVNGESPNLVARAFLSWFTHKFDPGDHVKLSVLDANGEQREVTYHLPPPR